MRLERLNVKEHKCAHSTNSSSNETVKTIVKTGNKDANLKIIFTCYVCSKNFSSRKSLKRHLNNIHSKRSLDHLESESTDSLDALVRKGNKHKGSRDPHTCYLCKKITTSRGALKTHFQIMQSKGNFDHNDLKSGHSKAVEALVRKGNEKAGSRDPHTCWFCKKVFSFRCTLKLHIEASHYQQKKFICDLCPKFYHHRVGITAHMIDVHCKKWFSCDLCNFKTSVERLFESHKAKHDDKGECPICHERVRSIKYHMKTHTTREKCSICHKMVFKHYMTKHTKQVHHEECAICHEVFTDKKELHR